MLVYPTLRAAAEYSFLTTAFRTKKLLAFGLILANTGGAASAGEQLDFGGFQDGRQIRTSSCRRCLAAIRGRSTHPLS